MSIRMNKMVGRSSLPLPSAKEAAMRNLTWLVVAVVVVAFALPAAAGEITVGKRAIPPYAHIGDTITYEMWVENPNNEFDLEVNWTWDVLARGTPD
jgi:hypothetical protein